jgi:pyruvate-formate lyase-activating enzyme
MSDAALIALNIARELLLAYFRLMETTGLTPEEKAAHRLKIEAEFYNVDLKAIRDPEEL